MLLTRTESTHHRPEVGVEEDVAVVVDGEGVAVHTQLKMEGRFGHTIGKCRDVPCQYLERRGELLNLLDRHVRASHPEQLGDPHLAGKRTGCMTKKYFVSEIFERV